MIENDVKTDQCNDQRPAIYTVLASGGLASFVLKTLHAGAAVVVKGILRDDSPCRLDPTWNHWLVMASSVTVLTGDLPAGHAHLLCGQNQNGKSADQQLEEVADPELGSIEDQAPL